MSDTASPPQCKHQLRSAPHGCEVSPRYLPFAPTDSLATLPSSLGLWSRRLHPWLSFQAIPSTKFSAQHSYLLQVTSLSSCLPDLGRQPFFTVANLEQLHSPTLLVSLRHVHTSLNSLFIKVSPKSLSVRVLSVVYCNPDQVGRIILISWRSKQRWSEVK